MLYFISAPSMLTVTFTTCTRPCACTCRLWERLGFIKAGLIPRAGRLRRADGDGEEYVDAWVIYKDFEEEKEKGLPFH